MAKTKSTKGAEAVNELKSLSANTNEPQYTNGIGQVVHSPTRPRHIGGRLLRFDDLNNFNWEIKSQTHTETRKVHDPEDGQFVSKSKVTRRAGALCLTLYRMERDSVTGNPERREFTFIPGLPFFTFDNEWTQQGFSAKDVAQGLWNHVAFFESVVPVMMTEQDLEQYFLRKTSPDVLALHDEMRRFMESDELTQFAKLVNDVSNTKVEYEAAEVPSALQEFDTSMIPPEAFSSGPPPRMPSFPA